jgi:hypothetical protein
MLQQTNIISIPVKLHFYKEDFQGMLRDCFVSFVWIGKHLLPSDE